MRQKNKIIFSKLYVAILIVLSLHTFNYCYGAKVITKQRTNYQNMQGSIKGKIVDAETGETIPFCSIVIENSHKGTSSNEEGEFEIKIDSLPTRILFSHISYEKQFVTVTSTSDLLIKLTPLRNSLEEVLIEVNKHDNYALHLAKKAYLKMSRSSQKSKYGKALYRQKTKNNDKYSEFSEIIYDVKYNTTGIENWEIIEGRYALKENSVNNKNFTLLTRLLKSIQPDTDDLIFPLHENLEDYYSIKVVDVLATKEEKLFILGFTPLKQLTTPTFSGEVYIDAVTNDVLKVKGTISRDDLKLVRLTEKNTLKKNYSLSYEITFKQDHLLGLVIDYINIEQKFDYYKGNVLHAHVLSTSNLFFYEYYEPVSNRKLGRRFKSASSDWENLNEIGYNEKFWRENQIVKRTPVEKEVIEAFQRDKKFESIFINSRQQIALMQSGISNDPFIKWLGAAMNTYANNNQVEKIYLHTNKEQIYAGESLWLSAYIVSGANHYFSDKSKVLHIDIVNAENKIVSAQKFELLNGRAKGAIPINKDFPPGFYHLRAYTNWMRNFDAAFFFNKTIEVLNDDIKSNSSTLNLDDKTAIQFFPEGGDAVNGLLNTIAFKATGKDGGAKKVKGKVVNTKGEHVANLNTLSEGIGYFRLKFEKGESYKAILSDNSEYSLPKAKAKGYVLKVDNRNAKAIRIQVQASESLRNAPFYIIGHIRNKKLYQSKLEFNGATSVNFEIPKSKLPSGVVTLTLFDEHRIPQCERILFVNNQDELFFNVKPSKQKFESKDQITLDIHAVDSYGRPVESEFSIAVTDESAISKKANESTIVSYLLLESELKGKLQMPGVYFNDQKSATRSKLDMIMLTHGWRRFNWNKLNKQSGDSLQQFPFKEKLTISGIAKSMNNKLLRNVTLKIIAKSNSRFGFEMFTTNTNANGRFSLTMDYHSSLKLAFSAYSKAKVPIDVKISLDDDQSGTLSTLPTPDYKVVKPIKPIVKVETKSKSDRLKKLEQKNESAYNLATNIDDSEKLEEVTVKAKVKPKRSSIATSSKGISPDTVVYMKDFPPDISAFEVIESVAGVNVSGSGRQKVVQIRGLYSPLWVIDGLPVASESPAPLSDVSVVRSPALKPPEKVPQMILDLDPNQIERMEILKSASAAAYGSRGAGGVILIYTKRGGGVSVDAISPEFDINAYAEIKEFYSPRYDIEPDKKNIPDYRTTIYWNPLVKTDKNGKASVTFFNSDTAKKIQIVIEGISYYGVPGVYLQTLGKN